MGISLPTSTCSGSKLFIVKCNICYKHVVYLKPYIEVMRLLSYLT